MMSQPANRILTLSLSLLILGGLLFWSSVGFEEPPAEPSRLSVAAEGKTVTPPPSVELAGQSTELQPPAVIVSNFRIRHLRFQFGASSMELIAVQSLPGRIKRPPHSMAPDRLEFEVRNAAAELLYEGSVEHPLVTHREIPPLGQEGWASVSVEHDQPEEVYLRLPEEYAGQDLAWYEIRAADALRRHISTIRLP